MLYEICEQIPPFWQMPVKQREIVNGFVTNGETVVVVTEVVNWHKLPENPDGQAQVERIVHVPPF